MLKFMFGINFDRFPFTRLFRVVHVPPPQEDEFAPQPFNAPQAPQKHYKIIFIKAPSAPSVSRQQLQQLAQPQSEEKVKY